MSNEMMREEFEVWYSEQFKYSDKKLTRHGDTYLSPFIAGLWMSWQASRAALCVNLPRQTYDYDLDCDTMIAHHVGKALDAAGVRYK